MKHIIIFCITILLSVTHESSAQLGNLLKKAENIVKGEISPDDIGSGLKEALEIGVSDAVQSLSAQNGYLDSPYKVLIPEEAQAVTAKVSKIPGFNNIEKDLVKKMNEAAELAAQKAGPIFVNAIKQMSFEDAMYILKGDDDAATKYLEHTARQNLYEEFEPVIQSALDEVNARSLWQSAVNTYNKIPFSKKLNPELDDHVNQRALDGLFSLIGQKELGIRNNVNLRTTPLLQEVFARQD